MINRKMTKRTVTRYEVSIQLEDIYGWLERDGCYRLPPTPMDFEVGFTEVDYGEVICFDANGCLVLSWSVEETEHVEE